MLPSKKIFLFAQLAFVFLSGVAFAARSDESGDDSEYIEVPTVVTCLENVRDGAKKTISFGIVLTPNMKLKAIIARHEAAELIKESEVHWTVTSEGNSYESPTGDFKLSSRGAHGSMTLVLNGMTYGPRPMTCWFGSNYYFKKAD